MTRSLVLLALSIPSVFAQMPWPPKWDNFKFTFEERAREEARTGVTFGREGDLENPLFRTRIGAQWKPAPWLRLSAMGQDSRSPQYGGSAPASARDTMDLHEGYVELFPDRKTGFGALVGRNMINYGEGRLIGTSLWPNTSRTFDAARVYYRLPRARIELLFASIVKVLPDSFNKPVLGDRLWGTYNTFPELIRHGVVEAYVLRRDQNRPGGFTGVGTLGINTFGGRATGPAPWGIKYSLEAAAQTGHVGPQSHRAAAWFSNASGRIALKMPLDLSMEYKYASGSADPLGPRSGTFDQLYATNHNNFGHADLFGWRNLHNLRSWETLNITKRLAFNVMYDNFWLASAKDSLYNGQGRPIVRSASGSAGTYVGQELDFFATFEHSGFRVGAGFAHLFAGEFLKQTTPGVNTRYLYLFQSYSF